MSELIFGRTTSDLVHGLINRGISNISVVIRHSARYYDYDRLEMEPFMVLTEEGKELSFDLGKTLPPGMTARLYSSAFGRCIETAYLIDKGYVSRGGQTVNNQVEELLSPYYVKNPFELAGIMGSKPDDFIRYWFDGNISEEIIGDPKEIAREILSFPVDKVNGSTENQVNIGVTHDWNMYLIKEYCMGLRHEEVGNVDYLEGVVVYRENGQIFLENHQCDPIKL